MTTFDRTAKFVCSLVALVTLGLSCASAPQRPSVGEPPPTSIHEPDAVPLVFGITADSTHSGYSFLVTGSVRNTTDHEIQTNSFFLEKWSGATWVRLASMPMVGLDKPAGVGLCEGLGRLST